MSNIFSDIVDNVRGGLVDALGDAMDCTRVWSAWGHGTMSSSDFDLVVDQPDRVDELVQSVVGALERNRHYWVVLRYPDSDETYTTLQVQVESQTALRYAQVEVLRALGSPRGVKAADFEPIAIIEVKGASECTIF